MAQAILHAMPLGEHKPGENTLPPDCLTSCISLVRLLFFCFSFQVITNKIIQYFSHTVCTLYNIHTYDREYTYI